MRKNYPTTLEARIERQFRLNKLKKAKLNWRRYGEAKKIEAFEKIKQGELFAEKVKTVFQKIQNNIIDISSLQLSNDSQNDLQLSYNKFSGSQEDLLQDKIKEKTKLEIIQKIKNGEL